jgi:hypothetical protein
VEQGTDDNGAGIRTLGEPACALENTVGSSGKFEAKKEVFIPYMMVLNHLKVMDSG